MKRTAFFPIHQQIGAKLVEFGGYEMPVFYSSIMDEHRVVRTRVGMFDVSHMGEFEVSGRDALPLLQKVTTNDVSKLSKGKAQYSAMCYPDGGIVDDLLVYNLGDRYLLVVNASNIAKDFDWIRSNAGAMHVSLIDRSEDFSLLAVQGPRSVESLQQLADVDFSTIPYYAFVEANLAGVQMIISRTGYTGEVGYELYFDSSGSTGEKVWNAIMEAGNQYGIRPIGLGARDTLRLEMGYCLYGNDIDQTTNPLEAGLGWITKLSKGEFNGSDSLQKVKAGGSTRQLVGFVMDEDKTFPRHDYEIRSNGNVIGRVTSGTVSPSLDKGIGMGYVASQYSQPGTKVNIVVRNREVQAHIVKPPFIQK